MKKSFLLLLLPLFALASWAQTAPTLAPSPITWDGDSHQLITAAGGLPGGYHSSYTGGTWFVTSGTWPNLTYTFYNDAHAGIQYFVQEPGGSAPTNGNSGSGTWESPYTPTMNGFTNITDATATAPGTYTVWYRLMRDHEGTSGDYQTGNWINAGQVTIKVDLASLPHYVNGPQRKDLTYNDEEQELITAGTQFCDFYQQENGGVQYIVKTTHGTPAISEVGSPSIPKGKDAGVYYVYYRVLKDNNLYTMDSPWNEVGVGGIEIKKRNITKDDFAITFADGLVYKKATPQNLVTDFAWTNSITRGTVEYSVQVGDETPVVGATAQGTNANDYKVSLKITGDANHNDLPLTDVLATVNIAKADYVFDKKPAANTGLVYNGTAQQLLDHGIYLLATEDAGTVKYTLYKGTEKVGDFDAYDKVVATNAGTYNVEWTYTADAPNDINWNEASGKVENIEIAKADWNLNAFATIADFTYDGDPHALLDPFVEATGFVTGEVGEVKYTVTKDGAAFLTDVAEAAVEAQNVGEYEVTFTVAGTDNFNEVTATTIAPTVTINKAKLHTGAQGLGVNYGDAVDYHDLIKLDMDEIPAGEDLKSDPAALKDALIKFVSFAGATLDAGKPTALPTDVGYYAFTLEPIEGNYEFVNFIPEGGLTIKAIDATPATVAAATLEYNGADQELLVVDESLMDGGEMLYFLGETKPTVIPDDLTNIGVWSKDIPEAKAAGEYKVWYFMKGDKNHNDGAVASVPVTIAQKPLADAMFNLAAATAVFTGENLKPAYTFADGEPSALVEADFTVATLNSKPEAVTDMVNVGSYTFVFTATADGNYTGTITKTFTITPKPIDDADVEFALETASVVYDGKDHKADVKVVPSAPLTEADFDVVLPATMVNAGEYTVTLNGKGNYKDSNATAKFTITQKPLDASFFVLNGENPVIFDGTDQIPGFELLATEPIVAADFTFATTNSKDEAVTEMVDADTYTYTFTASAAGNYSGEVTVDFVINQATAEFVDPVGQVLTYNGTEQSLISEGFTDAVAGVVDPTAGKVEYKVEFDGETFIDWTEDYASILAKNAGTYTVSYKFTASELNYTNPEVTGSFDVKILQANVTYRMGKQVETYTGEAFEPVEGEAYTLAAGGLFVGDEDVITFSFEEGFDATTACEEGRTFDRLVYTFKDDIANYTVGFQNTGTLIIKKADVVDYEAPAAIDRTYNGKAQTLVTEGKVNEIVDEKPLGTIMFSDKENGEYTTAVPQGTDAKKYDVWFKVVGDANHTDTKPVKVENVEIKPYTLTASMIKAKELQKVYNGEVQNFDISLKVTLADNKERTLVNDQDYTIKINDKAVKDVKIKDAGDYVYTFTGKGNYTGVISTTAKITKAELMAIVPNAVKTYDGTTTIEPEEFQCTDLERKLYGGLKISGMAADDKIDLGGKTLSDFIAVPANAVNVGTYTDKLTIDLDAFPEQANYTIKAEDVIAGSLTINKAAAVKIGFKTKTKVLDEFWPVTEEETVVFYYKSYGTADNLKVVDDDLIALEGELFDPGYALSTILDPSRDAGEVYNKDGYTFYLNFKKASSGTPLATKINQFKANYENVTFGTTKFYITPFEGNIKVSIKSTDLVFDGKDHAGEYTWATDLSNMVVTGLPAGKNKNEIFSKLPTVKIKPNAGSDKICNAGDYNIIFEGGESENYDMKKVQLVQGSYLTIEPFEITPEMVTIPDQQVKVGADANKDIKHDAFTFAEGAVPAAEGVNLYDVFQVVANPSFISGGKIKAGENPAEGLILAYKSNTNPQNQNYVFDEVFGFLSVTGTPDLLVLDDTKDIATLDRENTDVTFTNRSIRQDDWNVVCLPFDATIKQISDAFGYAAIDLLKKESADGSMHFVVTTSGTVPAGEPFIIKPTSDPELDAKSNFVQVKFTGVTVKKFSDNPEPVKDSAGNKFCGTFKAQTTFFGEKFWYMSNSEWKQASKFTEANPVKLGAYRAYIETATAGARIFIEEPDGSITAINAIDLNNNTMDEGWYTVNGMKLNAAPTQKGTYIKDGKKVFVK